MNSMNLLDQKARRRWRYTMVDKQKKHVPWHQGLPVLKRIDRDHRVFHNRIEQILEHLPESFIENVPEALGRWWSVRPVVRSGVELYLVKADGSRQKLVIYRQVIRVGRAESCHIQLAGKTVSSVHCELRNDQGQLSVVDLNSTNGTQVNGKPIPPMKPWLIKNGDTLSIPPYRLVIGQTQVEFAEPEVSVKYSQSMPLNHSPDVLQAVGGSDMVWSRVRGEQFTALIGLPYVWRKLAYRALELNPPVDDDALMNEVDLSLTSYLFNGFVRELGQLSGVQLQASGLFRDSSPLFPVELPENSILSLFEVRVGGMPSEVPCIWWMDEEGQSEYRIIELFGDVPFTVHIDGGYSRLTYRDFTAIEQGDIILPDEFYPGAGFDESNPEGPVWLRCQKWVARGQIRTQEEGQQIEFLSDWQITTGGFWMDTEMEQGENMETTPEPVTVPDELEVTLVVELMRIDVPLKEIATWKEGAVIELEKPITSDVTLVLNQGGHSRIIGRGRVVNVEGRMGIELTEWYVRRGDT